MLLCLLALSLASPFAPKLGVGLEGVGGRGLEFADAMKTSRAFEAPGGGKVAVDASGWPLADARTVVFDHRPTMAWAPPIDDPDAYQIDVSGTYHVSFEGKADLTADYEQGSYVVKALGNRDGSNLYSVSIPKGKALLILTFRNTNGGVRNVRVVRPGYSVNSRKTFTQPFLEAVRPFPVLRFMDWLGSNNSNPFYGDAKNTTDWSDRRLTTDASQNSDIKRGGVAWEYVAELANTTGKDIWINLPAASPDEYVRQVAQLMAARLKPRVNIYTEYNNEVWNWGFTQATYNQMAAEAEVKKGDSLLNNDGATDRFVWRRRRYAKRTIEIGRIFADAFGKNSLNRRVRPIVSWWVIYPHEYRDMLEWVRQTYGEPKQHIYAIAGAPYFNTHEAAKDASVSQLLDALKVSIDHNTAKFKVPLIQVAKDFGVKAFCYEGGPDSGGGDPANIANRIRAHRHPRMRDLVRYDLKDTWFDKGGDLFMYFTLTSPASRYGMWGALEDVTKRDTPKWKALMELLGRS